MEIQFTKIQDKEPSYGQDVIARGYMLLPGKWFKNDGTVGDYAKEVFVIQVGAYIGNGLLDPYGHYDVIHDFPLLRIDEWASYSVPKNIVPGKSVEPQKPQKQKVECCMIGCTNLTTSRYGLCCKHYRAAYQWARYRNTDIYTYIQVNNR